MAFNFQNAIFGYILAGSGDVPEQVESIGSFTEIVEFIVSMGIIRSGDVISLNERETVLDTAGNERVISYELVFEAEILSNLIETELLAALDNKTVYIIGTTLGATDESFGALWDGNLRGTIDPNTPFLITTPLLMRVQEPKTFGSGNVAAYRVTGKAYAGSKAALLRRHKM